MRTTETIKINAARGKDKSYRPNYSDVALLAQRVLAASGAIARDELGKIYWIEIAATGASATAVFQDNGGAASGDIIASRAIATDKDGKTIVFNPPREFSKGIYATLSTATVTVCYEPFAKLLVCRVTIFYPPGTLNLVCRVTVRYTDSISDLVSQVTILRESSSGLVSRVTVSFAGASTNLVSRVTTLRESSSDLVSRATVLRETSGALVSRVNVIYAAQVRYLISRVTVLRESSSDLVCQVTKVAP